MVLAVALVVAPTALPLPAPAAPNPLPAVIETILAEIDDILDQVVNLIVNSAQTDTNSQDTVVEGMLVVAVDEFDESGEEASPAVINQTAGTNAQVLSSERLSWT